MSKHLPPSINLTGADIEDVNLQLHVSNHILLQVLLSYQAEQIAKTAKISVEEAKAEINNKLSEAKAILLSEIDALYGA